MTNDIHKDVLPQLAKLAIDPHRPLIISDADEVLFNFMIGLEGLLASQELYFDWSSFALTGNIRRIADKQPISQEEVGGLLSEFFEHRCIDLPAVDGAAAGLKALSKHAQIIVLSNIPPKYAHHRVTGLKDKGMDYPLIANIGSKGEVVRHLTQGMSAPAFFIDDIPHNHSSVNIHAAHVHRLHYIADERLSALLGPAEHSHTRLYNWPEIEAHIIQHIETGAG
ncbi:hypothetical protein NBZ79_13295 [Sneathiella marina]|uniref:HAD family hydrolase n=1 Tax=Sneathiella marina TaxID=2950108 RepID=A0ABY4VZW0_9PROT|nr:hypothetical protein [Sneathiella marina]USG60151.1 hypothetical protein NBZ79_13295 [Sneathiella marina]